MLEGTLEYFLTDELTDEKTVLFSTNKAGVLIGWEVLHAPQRFITNVAVASGNANIKKITIKEFLSVLTPQSLQSICRQINSFLEISFLKQSKLLSQRVEQGAIDHDKYFIANDSDLTERIRLLKSSPFFGEFLESEIQELAHLMIRREYQTGDLIYDQHEDTGGLFILVQGEVSIRRQEGDAYLRVRSISTPGYIFGWSSSFGAKDICRTITEQKTSVYFISKEDLNSLTEGTSFGVSFFKMIIWLMSNRLQLAHSWYLQLKENYNLVSVNHLIDINRPRIPLPSALHQIPHLLKDNTTQNLAFDILHDLHHHGTRQERHLASICLDLLKSEERERLFLSSLGDIYNVVVQGESTRKDENRRLCAENTKKAFDHVYFHLEGKENLPTQPGNIFIYNHLLNHPYYTLSNLFQLTLDSHFMSSLILNDHYDDPGIRVVRYGKSSEYGHQDYYDNLGYINVYSDDSDLKDAESRSSAKEKFYQQANEYLNNGYNVIVSPEGTSFSSEESPGMFKMGPFNLAMNADKEPFIVPVVFYNFDKRITEGLFYCEILKPFKVSDKKNKSQSLKDFVIEYQKEFAKHVSEARIVADRLLQKHNRR
ncbi:MAG: cyclic nucleotide-binding domain-containing protein [Bacteroidota bacterium]